MGSYRTGIRHDQNIPQVSPPGAAQMSMRKAHHDTIGIMIAGTPVPAFEDILRTQLHGPERSTGAHKYMPMTAGPDKGIDIGGGRLRIQTADRNIKEQGQKEWATFHSLQILLRKLRIFALIMPVAKSHP